VDFDVNPEGDVNFRMSVSLPANTKLYVALCYPWSFGENEEYLEKIEKTVHFNEDIYFNKEVLIMSPEGIPYNMQKDPSIWCPSPVAMSSNTLHKNTLNISSPIETKITLEKSTSL
jgi:hypothetical protein